MEVLLYVVLCLVHIACFMVGAKVGQATAKGEKVELPNINPFKAIQEREAKREAQKEMDRVETILRNIDSYDGTGRGQKDVPGR